MEISVQDIWIKNNQQMRKEELPPDFIEQGISLYEVLRVIDGVPLFIEQHLERLKNSAKLTNLDLPLNDEEIKKRLQALINSNQVENGNIKFVLNYPEPGQPTGFYAYFVEHDYPTKEVYRQGVKTVLVHVERSNPHAKVDRAEYRNTVDEAKRRTGSYEALLVNREGHVSEGGRSNLFMVKGDIIYTAPVGKVLKGITRQMVLAACQNKGYTVVEKEISLQEMLNMDAIFISSTSPKVLPVSQVDDKIINSGSNKIIRDIMTAYDAIIADYVKNHK